jgi:hypothetical protein
MTLADFFNFWTLLGIFAVLMCGCFAVWLIQRVNDREARPNAAGPPSPLSTFEQLCQTHQLSPQEVTFLKQSAMYLAVPDPLHFFIDPRLLQQLQPQSAATAGTLLTRCFGPLALVNTPAEGSLLYLRPTTDQ